VQWVAWTAGDAHDLDRCSELLTERGAYVGRDISEGITLLEGRDPDGLPSSSSTRGPSVCPAT
jgi:hypothetical protein